MRRGTLMHTQSQCLTQGKPKAWEVQNRETNESLFVNFHSKAHHKSQRGMKFGVKKFFW